MILINTKKKPTRNVIDKSEGSLSERETWEHAESARNTYYLFVYYGDADSVLAVIRPPNFDTPLKWSTLLGRPWGHKR